MLAVVDLAADTGTPHDRRAADRLQRRCMLLQRRHSAAALHPSFFGFCVSFSPSLLTVAVPTTASSAGLHTLHISTLRLSVGHLLSIEQHAKSTRAIVAMHGCAVRILYCMLPNSKLQEGSRWSRCSRPILRAMTVNGCSSQMLLSCQALQHDMQDRKLLMVIPDMVAFGAWCLSAGCCTTT